mgnify:CR=1 FL=1
MTNVLIVDDSDAIRTIIKACLGAGFDCQGTRSLFDARLSLEQSMPHLAFVADWLPDGDGFQIVREMRTSALGVKPFVVLMSTERVMLTWTHRLSNGADQMLLKPFYANEISSCLFAFRKSRGQLTAA